MFIITTLMLLMVVPLPAQEPAASEPEPLISEELYQSVGVREGVRSSEGDGVGGLVGSMATGLVLVIGLAVAAGVVLKRLGGRRRLLGAGGKHLELLETMPLGLKRAVSLIKVGDRVVLVGQSEQGLSQLALLEANVLAVGGSQPPSAGAPEVTMVATAAPVSEDVPGLDSEPEGPTDPIARFQAKLRQALERGA
ncbi:MAG: flagellar biosynthetic protein FliO [Planctomycetota bacterium]|jgi:flagellar biogenesis protein FliO|nr:flagellar biosynthetic protein FliO [Planctomycetota bacterium]